MDVPHLQVRSGAVTPSLVGHTEPAPPRGRLLGWRARHVHAEERRGYSDDSIRGILGGNFQGMIVEAIGTFVLVLVICVAALSLKANSDYAPWAIGGTFGFAVMVTAPLTGAGLNPARWFGPALVGNDWGGVWPYVLGPLVGALLAVVVFRLIEPSSDAPAKKKPLEPAAMGDKT